MRILFHHRLIGFASLLLISAAVAQPSQTSTLRVIAAPRLINISGILNPSNGAQAAASEVVTLAVYSAPSGGAPIWQETQTVDFDRQGHYSVVLGASRTNGLPPELFAAGEPRWVGLQIMRPGAVEQTRELLPGVPLPSALSVRHDGFAPQAVGTAVSSSPAPDLRAQPAPRATSGSPNSIAKFVTSTDLGNSVMTESSGMIGLGTTIPHDYLHVSFNDSTGAVTGYAVQNLGTSANSFSGMLFYDQNGNLGQFQGFNNTTHEYRINNIASSGSINFMLSGAPKFTVRSDGDINIANSLRKAGNVVLAADTGVHIGTVGVHTSFFAAGVTGVMPGGATVPVLVDANGQFGTLPSSRRYKEDIQDMGAASSDLLRLRPVVFRYHQPYPDGSKPIDYGLIAEEVAEIYPDLVVKDKDGQIQTVQYQKLTPMLLNELKKEHEVAQQRDETIRLLRERLAAVEALLPAKANPAAAAQ